jgi:hypothetical protein
MPDFMMDAGLALMALEKHYRVKELSELWGFCRNTITKMFSNEEGVLKVQDGKKVTLSIPASVVSSVHERLGKKPFEASLPGRNPLGVIRLGNLNGRVAKKPRNIIKLKAA